MTTEKIQDTQDGQNMPYIKVYKNETLKRVSYNWEIKLYTADVQEFVKKNNELAAAFPTEELI